MSAEVTVKLAVQAIGSIVFGLLFFGVCLFLPAWTFDYWQGWLYIGVFMFASMVPGLYIAVKLPAALERRLHGGPMAESRPAQRVIICVLVATVVATLVVSALDHRFGWSSVPLAAVIAGAVLAFTGLTFSQVVIIQNNYAATSITVEAEQPLIDTGLYSVVRHPMYAGVLIMMVGTPVALDSLWGYAGVVAMLPVLAARIIDEERMLAADLTGYREYAESVRYRLVPGLW